MNTFIKGQLRVTQAKLLQQCQKMAIVMNRDLSILGDYEITEETIAEFKAETDIYRYQMNDRHYRTLWEYANIEKAGIRAKLVKQVQYILRRVSSLYAYGSVDSHFFGKHDYFQAKDSALIRNSINLLEVAKERIDELKRRNVKQSHLEDLEKQIRLFEESIAKADEKKNLRLAARETRLYNGLALQEKLKEYAVIGKLACEEGESYANYKDYVLRL